MQSPLAPPCLYLIVSSHLSPRPLPDVVKEAVEMGVKVIQLREKKKTDREILKLAQPLREITRERGALFLINDRVDLATLADADGVHLGQDDIPVGQATHLLGPKRIVGVSARTVELAQLAEAEGADYLGSGAAFDTSTKEDAVEVGLDRIREIADAVKIPVFPIGGINRFNVGQLVDRGFHRAVVCREILEAGENLPAVVTALVKGLSGQ